MAIDLTLEQRQLGQANYERAVDGISRRNFLKSTLAAAGAGAVVTPAVWYGYQSIKGKPVKAALIGGGDEGGVLVGEHNPEYLEFIAVCDIRPSNQKRIFEDETKTNPRSPRKGFNRIYGKNARGKIKVYTDYRDMLQSN